MTHDAPPATRRALLGLSVTAAFGALVWRLLGSGGAAATAAHPLR